MILFGMSNAEVHIYDSLGNFMVGHYHFITITLSLSLCHFHSVTNNLSLLLYHCHSITITQSF